MQGCSEAKKPCKGILKPSSSFDRPGASYRKSAKFDELNVLQTYHPLDKDYGHMKIDEPKTPFNYVNPEEQGLDADLLTEKLKIAADTQTPSFGDDDNFSDEEFPETAEEKVRRMEFEKRRKAHYNEFEAVRIARKLIEEELDEADDDEEGDGDRLESLAVSVSSENKSDLADSEYVEEEKSEGQNTLGGVDSASVVAASASSFVSVGPMEVDNEDPPNPCGREDD